MKIAIKTGNNRKYVLIINNIGLIYKEWIKNDKAMKKAANKLQKCKQDMKLEKKSKKTLALRKEGQLKNIQLKATDFQNKMFSIIGHDLRGPIGTISSIVSLAMDDQLSENKRQKMLSLTKDSTVAAYTLLENLLIWANNEQGKINFEPKNLKLYDIVRNSINLLKEEPVKNTLILDIDQYYPDTGTQGEKGSGHGLRLCFEFIKKNKGDYKIISEKGKGTNFIFSLPVAI